MMNRASQQRGGDLSGLPLSTPPFNPIPYVDIA
jgi:hypothetical protein